MENVPEEREWAVDQPGNIAALRESGCPRVLALLLAARGYENPEEARRYLAAAGGFSDPMDFAGMREAAERIGRALGAGEKIAVYGDYDVDGVTAAAILTLYLTQRGADVCCRIPEREGEGYGLNENALRELAGQGVALVVTVDTGISAFAEAKAAKALGIDLVVTDHHRPRDEVPDAAAVVDAKLPGSGPDFKDLSGAGVALKLCCALEGCDTSSMLARYGDLCCLATVADVVPLTGENRAIVRRGLKLIEKRGNLGVSALLRAAGAEGRPVTATLLAFTLAPRINAAGRMGSAFDAFRLLTGHDPAEAERLAKKLCDYNRVRQETETGILEEIRGMAEEDPELLEGPVAVLAGEGWHNGVIGIAASRVAERTQKPAILISVEGDVGRGSCRSVPGFDIFKALSACSELLDKYGGHELAAGFTIQADRIEEFTGAIYDYAFSQPEPARAPLALDCALEPSELTLETARQIRLLEPFGNGNPEPLFFLPGVCVTGAAPVSNGKHLRVAFDFGGVSASAMLFRAESAAIKPGRGDCLDLAVTLEADRYNGTERLSLIIRALRRPRSALYERFARSESLEVPPALYPARRDFAAVYRRLREAGGAGVPLGDLLRGVEGAGVSLFKLRVILDVFEEGGLAREDGRLFFVEEQGRMELSHSAVYQKLKVSEGGGPRG